MKSAAAYLQLPQWLTKDLEETDLPTIVFIHQSLARENGGVENQAEIRAIFEAANREAREQKVIACFTGHHHLTMSSGLPRVNV